MQDAQYTRMILPTLERRKTLTNSSNIELVTSNIFEVRVLYLGGRLGSRTHSVFLHALAGIPSTYCLESSVIFESISSKKDGEKVLESGRMYFTVNSFLPNFTGTFRAM
jgi:hypothetical protein